jgi:hypothetical protein
MNALSDIISSKSDDFFNTKNSLPDSSLQTSVTSDDQTITTNINLVEPESPSLKSEVDLTQIKAMAHNMRDQLDSMIRILDGEKVRQHFVTSAGNSDMLTTGEQIIEGVFNGKKMVGPDGKEYSIPPNYASKSKLVEGDLMKLTITNQGRFIYKSIAPIERKRLKGELVSDPTTDQWSVLADGKTYKILTASVTFWKGHPGDDVIFFVPESGESNWGAVENIINSST